MVRYGVLRKYQHLNSCYFLRSSSSSAVSPTSNGSPCGSHPIEEISRTLKWASTLAPFLNAEGTQRPRLAPTAFGVLGVSVCLAVLGAQKSSCDGPGLQTTLDEKENASIVSTKERFFLSDSYRRELFFNYERRIRSRSKPEKVFLYFASVRDSEGQSFMTPADLMRAVVPVFPPADSVRVREGYLPGEAMHSAEEFRVRCPPSKFFMLFDTSGDGLISFAEYIFFVTLLSMPESSFNTAFKMFDSNGDGVIDYEEFKSFMNWMRESTRQGLAQRNGLHPGLKITTSVENGGLVKYFFGPDGKRLLRHEEFTEFLGELQKEMTLLEFMHYDVTGKGTISAQDFGLSMIAAADLSWLSEFMRRATDLRSNPCFKDLRITKEEFVQFAELRKKLPTLALAISNNGNVNKKDFKSAASKVCLVPLGDAVIDVIFHIFDLNEDGCLSVEEFLNVLERREKDIADPQPSGLFRHLRSWWLRVPSCRASCFQT